MRIITLVLDAEHTASTIQDAFPCMCQEAMDHECDDECDAAACAAITAASSALSAAFTEQVKFEEKQQ